MHIRRKNIVHCTIFCNISFLELFPVITMRVLRVRQLPSNWGHGSSQFSQFVQEKNVFIAVCQVSSVVWMPILGNRFVACCCHFGNRAWQFRSIQGTATPYILLIMRFDGGRMRTNAGWVFLQDVRRLKIVISCARSSSPEHVSDVCA